MKACMGGGIDPPPPSKRVCFVKCWQLWTASKRLLFNNSVNVLFLLANSQSFFFCSIWSYFPPDIHGEDGAGTIEYWS